MNGIKECKDSGASPQGTGNEGALTESCFKSEVSHWKGVCLFFHIEKSFKGHVFALVFLWATWKGRTKGIQHLSLSLFFFFFATGHSVDNQFRSSSEVLVCSSACPMPPLTWQAVLTLFLQPGPRGRRSLLRVRKKLFSAKGRNVFEVPWQVLRATALSGFLVESWFWHFLALRSWQVT